jgi:gliding motility-associated-like protein
LIMFQYSAMAQVVSTIAGKLGISGSINGQALSSATFNNPHGVEIDKVGNIYVADRFNHLIRKIDTTGNVTILAGSGVAGNKDGIGTAASFSEPWGLTVDSLGVVYVADTKNNKIRKILPDGTVTTLAGTGNFGLTDSSNPLAASFGNPTGVAVDTKGNIYVGDHLTHLIRKISKTGVVTTLAGNKTLYPNNFGLVDGLGQSAKFYRPYGIEVDKDGNVYVADEWNHAIRKVSSLGVVTTLGGNGTIGQADTISSLATFNYPWDVAVDSTGAVYVADGKNFVIRKINTTNNTVSTFAGKVGVSGGADGFALKATFNGATAISLNKENSFMIVGDAYNHLIRKITLVQPIEKPEIAFITTQNDSATFCQNEKVSIKINGKYDYYNVYLDSNMVLSTFDTLIDLSGIPIGRGKISVIGVKARYDNTASNVLKVNIKATDNTRLSVSKSTGLCQGDSVYVSTSNGTSVLWNNGKNVSGFYTDTTGKFYVQNTLEKCFLNNDTISVLIQPNPQVKVLASQPVPYFEGDSVLLKAYGADNYSWDAKVLDSIWVKNSGKYAAKGINKTGCFGFSDSLLIVFEPKPLFLKVLSPNGLSFCENDSLNLASSNASSITWFKNGFSLGITDSVLVARTSGLYFYKRNIPGQKPQFSDSVNVIARQLPLVDFSASQTVINKESPEVAFTSLLNASYQHFWDFGDSYNSPSVSNLVNPVYSYSQPSMYNVSLRVKDNFGCEAKITKFDFINYESQLFVATGFTPNGDGINDQVVLRGVSGSADVDFKIFNEWGELVFSSKSNSASWDGTYKDKNANAGNYSYLLIVNSLGKESLYKGIITLIR